jgi:hypothetical protein
MELNNSKGADNEDGREKRRKSFMGIIIIVPKVNQTPQASLDMFSCPIRLPIR